MMKTAFRLGAAALLLSASAAQAALFTVEWSGARYNNTATATGIFDFAAAPADLGGSQPLRNFPDARVSLNSFSITEGGVTTNFAQSDFSSFYFASVSQLDYSRELIGQSMGNGCLFGSFTACYGGPSGDFNLFRNNQAAPTGSFYFQLTSAAGNNLAVISMAPTMGAVPEPATWAMLILGFLAVGGAMRRRSAAKVSYAIA